MLRLLFILLLVLAGNCRASAIPEELQTALASFRTEGPFGWAFTQASSDGKETLVETYDPSQSPPFRWTLISKNGHPPSEADRRQYQQNKIVRTSALDAPRLERQLDLASCELKSTSEQSLSCSFRLKAGEQHDQAFENLSVELTVDRASKTIVRVEISSIQPFTPVLGVRIQASNTLLTYSIPNQQQPSLLQSALIKVEGRAFWLKSMNQTMSIHWSEHHYTGQRGK